MTNERAKTLVDDAITRLTELLEQGHSETLVAYLATLARFHRYSFGNALLIYFQRPEATRVAGFQTWRRLGRIVQRGEKGIAILAPCVYRRKETYDRPPALDEPEGPRVRGFKVAHVFDVSQTYGDPGAYLPRLVGGHAFAHVGCRQQAGGEPSVREGQPNGVRHAGESVFSPTRTRSAVQWQSRHAIGPQQSDVAVRPPAIGASDAVQADGLGGCGVPGRRQTRR